MLQFFSRSPERREAYLSLVNQFTECVLPGSWVDTRWLSRYSCIATVQRCRGAILGWLDLEENAKVRRSHEGEFVYRTLTSDEFVEQYKVVTQSLQVLYNLSVRLQAGTQSTWEGFMLVQGYMAKLVEKVDEAPRGAGRKLSKSLLNAMKERIPVDEAKEHAVFDFRFLEAEAAKKVLFRRSAVRRSMRIHARIFKGFYKEFTTSKKVIAKALTTGHARLQQKAIFCEVYDITNVAELEMRDEEDDISRMTIIMVDILQTFTIESAAAERGFSTLNRIRTKSRNRLSGENLSHCLSLKLNSLPQPEQVIGQWRKEMARRHRLSKPTSSSSSKLCRCKSWRTHSIPITSLARRLSRRRTATSRSRRRR